VNIGTSGNLSLETRAYDDPIVGRLVAELQAEYGWRYGGPDIAVVDPPQFAPPRGLLIVGVVDTAPVAMGGWRAHGDAVAEIKRMYVRESARRRGYSRIVLGELERTAAVAGHREIILNTGTEQPEAVALYLASGYEPAPPYGDYAGAPKALFFRKDLV
jgi:GNAT superfamily N-acetyltransferase